MISYIRHISSLVKLALAFTVLAVTGFAIRVEHVGSIHDSLQAPTAISVSGTNIAVIEPTARQLKIFTPDGILEQEINIEGNASGLVNLNDYLFLFCDRHRHQVIAVDTREGTSFEYLPSSANLVDPVDIKRNGDLLYVLDAGISGIHVFNMMTQQLSSFLIEDSEGRPIIFASSFAFDSRAKQFFILDQVNSTIWVISSTGDFINRFGSFGGHDGQLTRGGSIIYADDELIFVTDRYQGRVIAFTSAGEFVSNIDLIGIENGRLIVPTGLAIDDDNLLYVASTESAEIHIFKVAKSTATQAYFIDLIYPEEDDIIKPDEVSFSAKVEVVGDPELVTGMDFELYLDKENGAPVDSILNLQPSEISDLENGIIISEWRLENELIADTAYYWRARVRTGETAEPWTDMRKFNTTAILPDKYELTQNYPNPFNPATRIAFTVPTESEVQLIVYNVLGQQVKVLVNESVESGRHEVNWDSDDESGNRVASGIYFYRITTDDFTDSRKMVLMR